MTTNSREPVSLSFQVTKVIDKLRDGSEMVDHFHHQPVSGERAQTLVDKLGTKGLNAKEGVLLGEYERAKFYQKNNNGGKVLVFASSFDGIPGHVFGEARVVMTSLDSNHYFKPYLTFLSGTGQTPKFEADMFSPPFAPGRFSTLVINDMDVFDDRFMRSISKPDGQERSIVTDFFAKTRKLVTTGGIFLITDSTDMKTPKQQTLNEIKEAGWKLEDQQRSPVLKCFKFVAI